VVNFQNIMISISGGLFILFFSEKPEHPPSMAGVTSDNEIEVSTRE